VGLSVRILGFIDYAMAVTVPFPLKGKWIVELGNNHIREDVKKRRNISYPTGKIYFESLGMNHRSIDLNGKDGAIPLDLGKPIKSSDWIRKFDVLINPTVSTDVNEKYGKFAQWECWRNIHNFVKVKGTFIHILPRVGHWIGRYKTFGNAYDCEFVENLAAYNNYKINIIGYLMNVPTFDYVVCCLQKLSNRPFMEDKETFMKWCARKWQS